MKITKRQLRRIIQEEKSKLINEDAFDDVMRTASQILGPNIELDEEMDGNIVIVADEMDVEANYNQLMNAFPNGEMVEDGFVTGVMQESKITKRQLRRIIKEEKARLLSEQAGNNEALIIVDAIQYAIYDTLDQEMGIKPEEMAAVKEALLSNPDYITEAIEIAFEDYAKKLSMSGGKARPVR